MQYIGNIYNVFLKVLSKKDGFSVGEKITHLEKMMGKKMFYATDQEIYSAMEKYTIEPIEVDEPFEGDTEFLNFITAMENRGTVMIGRFYPNK